MKDSPAKRRTRAVLGWLKWFLAGKSERPGELDLPGFIIIPAIVLLGLGALLTAPIWLPIYLIARWSGYEP